MKNKKQTISEEIKSDDEEKFIWVKQPIEYLNSKEIKNNDFVWNAMRIGFLAMILSLIFSNTLNSLELMYFSMCIVIFVFVNSIIHLTKYKEKGFAITALVISSFYILTFLVGFVIGAIGSV